MTTTSTTASQTLPPVPRGDLKTGMLFSQGPEDGSRPYMYIKCAPPEGVPMTNIKMVPQVITISDLRGKENSVTLDHDSVKILNSFPDAVVDFDDEESVTSVYYPLVERQLLDNIPGAKKVHIFRHGIRHTKNPKQYAPPAAIAHIDQTPDAVADRVRMHLGDEAPELLKGRYRLIHHWRVLNAPAYSFPLAFVSSASMRDADIKPLVTHLAEFSENTGSPSFNPQQKWMYLSGTKPSEPILLQLFDSDALKEGSKVKGGRAVHGSFNDPRTPADAPHRFSIEVSALVFGE